MNLETQVYDSNSISVMEFPENIRHRPDMYVGSPSGNPSDGLYRLCREILDNSIDEYLANSNDNIYIFYDSKTHVTTVIDNGRGIPVGYNEKAGMDSLTAVVTKIHAGGKFNHNTYKTSSGKNGVGASAVNALSDHMQVWSNNSADRKWYTQSFIKGVQTSEVEKTKLPEEYKPYIKKTGTIITWLPDKTIFTDSINLNVSRLKRELHDIQYLCPKLRIKLFVDGNEIEYYTEKGLSELVSQGQQNETIFTYSDADMDVAINFTKDEGYDFKSYVNVCYTNLGGTHLDGLKKSICSYIKTLSKEKISNEDILEGMIGAIHCRVAEPQYQGQTKNELTNTEIEKLVIERLTPALTKFFKKNKALTDKIVKYAEEMLAKKQKMKADKALLKGISQLNSGAKFISDKFLDADRRKFKNSNDLEMFIVEGDSAGGHFNRAREAYQASLKIRGKIINAAKATAESLFGSKTADEEGNKEIKSIVSALGCGIQDDYDESKLRFGKVILMCFTGDTKVKMLDGTEKTFEELVEYEKEHPDTVYWVYSVDERGSFVPGCAKHPRITGYADELVEMTLDNGTSFKCTPDHLLMLRDGSYKEAIEISEGDSLMPLYTKINDSNWNIGRELYYDNSTNKWEFTHRTVMKKLFRNAEDGEHVHHIDRNILNNQPSNLQILSAEEHRRLHVKEHGEHGRASLIRYNKSKEHKERISYLWKNTDTYDNTTFGKNGYNGSEKHIADLKRAFADGRLTSKHLTEWNLTEEARKLHSDFISKSNRDEKINQTRRLNRMLNIGSLLKIDGYELSEALFEDGAKVKSIAGSTIRLTTILKSFGTFEAYVSAVENYIANADECTKAKIESLRNNAKDTLQSRRSGNVLTKKNSMARIGKLIFDRGLEFNSANYSKIRKELGAIRTPLFDRYDKYFDSYEHFREYCENYNHKIVSKRLIKLDTPVPVYDFTVDTYHNFVLGGGSQIVVHNCDADVDGQHITNLLLSFFITYMPKLIQNGHVYTVDAPLFIGNSAKGKKFGMTRTDVDNQMKADGIKDYDILRLKGWGECTAEQLSELCLDKKTRKLKQIVWTEDADDMLNKTMGDDVTYRKRLLGVEE